MAITVSGSVSECAGARLVSEVSCIDEGLSRHPHDQLRRIGNQGARAALLRSTRKASLGVSLLGPTQLLQWIRIRIGDDRRNAFYEEFGCWQIMLQCLTKRQRVHKPSLG